jgi:hypothetical protein
MIRAMSDVVTSGRRVQPASWRLPARRLLPGGAQRLGHDWDRVILCLMTGTQIAWIGPPPLQPAVGRIRQPVAVRLLF